MARLGACAIRVQQNQVQAELGRLSHYPGIEGAIDHQGSNTQWSLVNPALDRFRAHQQARIGWTARSGNSTPKLRVPSRCTVCWTERSNCGSRQY